MGEAWILLCKLRGSGEVLRGSTRQPGMPPTSFYKMIWTPCTVHQQLKWKKNAQPSTAQPRHKNTG